MLAEDPETGELAYKEVVRTFVRDTDKTVHVRTDGIEIETTSEHPFWVEGKGFVNAGSLQQGDMLRLSTGENARIESVWEEVLEEKVLVYNFEVADFHTYFVSELGVLVHNVCHVGGNYRFKKGIDVDLRGKGTYKDALSMAFQKTGMSKKEFNVTKWAKDKYGKSFPVEWRANNGAEVNIDIGHSPNGEAPTVPHIGWQTGGKRGTGGGVRGHIFVDDVPYNR